MPRSAPEKGTSRQAKLYDPVVTLRADNVRGKLEKLLAAMEAEIGVPLKTYTVINRAVEEALKSRKIKF